MEDVLEAVDYAADQLDAPKAAEDLLAELDGEMYQQKKFPCEDNAIKCTKQEVDYKCNSKID